jgi:hypothetical protein
VGLMQCERWVQHWESQQPDRQTLGGGLGAIKGVKAGYIKHGRLGTCHGLSLVGAAVGLMQCERWAQHWESQQPDRQTLGGGLGAIKGVKAGSMKAQPSWQWSIGRRTATIELY